MQRLMRLLLFVFLIMTAFPVSAKRDGTNIGNTQVDAGTGLGEILELWRNGNYDELWRRTTATGRQSKESFIGRLESAGRRPACCWEKLQDVTVTTQDARKATVRAKIGLEGNGISTEFVTKSFKMVNNESLWKISVFDILSLAENGKKKYRSSFTRKKQSFHSHDTP